jgi:transcriptional regulator with GAF, ATPase, and Fis domain
VSLSHHEETWLREFGGIGAASGSGKDCDTLSRDQSKASRRALKLTLIYVIVAGSLILFSDEALKWLTRDPDKRSQLSMIRCWGLLIVTGWLLYSMMRRCLQQWAQEWEKEMEQRKASENDLRRTQLALKTISACNGVLVRAPSEATLLAEICRVVIEKGGYRMAWVGFAENDEYKSIGIAARAGCDEGYFEKSRISWDETIERGRGPTGTSIRTGQIVICDDFQTNPLVLPWRKDAAEHGYASVIALPLRNGEKNFGVLTIYSAEAHAFNPMEVELLKELADDLAYGIQALRTQMERTETEQSLRAA